MKYLYLILLLIFFQNVFSQTEITGVVRDNDEGKPISGANVTVQEKSAINMLTYSLSDDKGNYKLNFKSSSDSVVVTVSGFNLKKESRTVSNRNQILNFKPATQAIELKEVRITPPKIRQVGDTINYLVDGYLDKNDRSIGDVLKKMPGIDVQESGAILYNNKPINKFYIEDMDLLQGRYGIATKNISAKDVATVQVLENHQPIKALENKTFSEEAALNLKLKDSAKGTLVANGQLGSGFSPLLWNNELFSMYFAKGRQNINTYKGNNTGDDVTRELTSFYSNEASSLSDDALLTVQSPVSPSISQKRYLFNRANAVTINNLWRLNKNYQLNANISYLNDRQEKDSYSRSVYYLPDDSLLTIEEKLNSNAHINQAEGEVQLNSNNDQFYLNNLLKFSGRWDTQNGNALSTTDSIGQQLDKPSYKLTNTFQWVKNKDRSTMEIYSFNGYSCAPQTLKVQPVLYGDLFEKTNDWSSMQQELTSGNFSSTNNVSWKIQTGRWNQSYAIGFKANLQKLNSTLFPETSTGIALDPSDSLKNDLQWNKFEWIFAPSYVYQYRKFQTFVNLPLSCQLLHINDYILGNEQNHNRLFFNPNVNFRYKLNAYWNVSANASYTNNLGGISNAYTGYIMRSYRSLLCNDGDLLEQKNQNYSVDVSYRHPIHAVWGSINANYFNNRSNLLYGSNYKGILSVQQSLPVPNTTEGYQVQGYLSKGIDLLASTLTLLASYNNSNASQISQDEIIQFKNERYTFKPGISSRISSWVSLAYYFTFSESLSKIRNDAADFVPIRNTFQNAQLNIFPVKGLTINLEYEYFYNSAIASGNRTMSFADMGAKYKWKDFEFNICYTNILNAKEYIAASYNEISTYYYAYDLRPAEILLKVRFKIKGK